MGSSLQSWQPLYNSSVRRSCSAPSLIIHGQNILTDQKNIEASSSSSDEGQEHALELYVFNRAFTSWAGGIMTKIPPSVALAFKDGGVCHFLLIARDKRTNTLHQFDFGPLGGRDTTMQVKQVYDSKTGKVKAGAPGEIREEIITQLPDNAMYVGSSIHWSLDDIRRHNMQQPTVYKLHENDCRHYVNNLVQQVTGLEQASVRLLQRNYMQRVQQQKEAWVKSLTDTTHQQTDPTITAAATGSQQPDDARQHQIRIAAAAATTLGMLCAAPAAVAAAQGQRDTHSQHAATLLLPLLAGLPHWDAPVVMLGQLLTNPFHWHAVHTTGQVAMLSSGAALGLKAFGATRAAALAITAKVQGSTVAGVAATSAVQRLGGAGHHLPRLLQSFRMFGSASSTVVKASVSTGLPFAPAVKAFAANMKARAAQVATPLIAIIQARQQKSAQKRQGLHEQAHEGRNPLHAMLRGGLLPLPLRGLHAPTASPDVKSGASSSTDALVFVRVPSSHKSQQSSKDLQPFFSRMQRGAPAPQACLLPTAALQAAVQPAGPAAMKAALVVQPRRRTMPFLALSARCMESDGEPGKHPIKLRWNGNTPHQRSLFQLACTPLAAWFGLPKKIQPASTSLIVPAAAIVPAFKTRQTFWNRPQRWLPDVSGKQGDETSTVSETLTLLEHAVKPLADCSSQPATSATHAGAVDVSTATCEVFKQAHCQTPTLPMHGKARKPRFSFRTASHHYKAASHAGRNIAAKPSSIWAIWLRSSSSWAEVVGLIITRAAQLQATKLVA